MFGHSNEINEIKWLVLPKLQLETGNSYCISRNVRKNFIFGMTNIIIENYASLIIFNFREVENIPNICLFEIFCEFNDHCD